MEFVTGCFHLQFREESAARAAARDVRAAGFVVEICRQRVGPWVIVARRREPFPAEEQHRYASRLRGLANAYGGDCERFVSDASRNTEEISREEALSPSPGGDA
jgi:hypothetical protein